MQIDHTLSQVPSLADRVTMNSQPAANDASALQPILPATASMQDAAVQISVLGAAAAAQEGNAAQEEGQRALTAQTAPESGASAVQSFAYGTLGLERPDHPQDESNAFYTAGRWLAAGITVGGIVSLLV
ncbi:hypothetical protein PQR02_35860 [Paraburkholderia sediminicola]|uniref:Uncharacterized protein n=1 Tax=Paraburkholderia rhynchosiae TaxID=487049 RepID=A0ACC7NNF9_9BURK